MAKFTGQLLIVAYNSGAWGANFVREAEVNGTAGVVDSTGAADTAKTYLLELLDATARVVFIADTSNATISAICALGTSSTLAISPNGTTTGHQKISGTAIVTGLDPSTGYNGLSLITVSFQFTAGATWANN